MSEREQFNIVVVGHVDHGKSTVIGRLLADTGTLPEGKLEQVRAECERSAKPFEYAFLLDALKAEQSQGITIDTARCFFKSDRRDYIIIDAPGHIEFLKNMITGAARAEAAVLVIDAKEGVRENSRRHGSMLALLGIRQVVVAVNKMDLAGYRQDAFEAIEKEYRAFLAQVGIQPLAFVPLAAFHGVNLTRRAPELAWYTGEPLLAHIDRFQKEADLADKPLRFPVQDVYKFTEAGDERRITAGRVETGNLRAGDGVVFYPSGKRATVKTLEEFNRPVPESFEVGKAAGFTLEPEIYVRAGELMAKDGQTPPRVGTRFRANVFWMGKTPFVPGRKYKIKLGTAEAPLWLESLTAVLDASSLTKEQRSQVEQHEVGECVLETSKPLAFDLSADVAQTGRFVIVDGYEIAGGGIILEDLGNERRLLERHLAQREKNWRRSPIGAEARSRRYGQGATFLVLTGEKENELETLGTALEAHLFSKGRFVYYLGLDNARLGLQADQGASGEDRSELIRRLGEVGRLFTDAGAVLITSAAGLEEAELETLQALASPAELLTVVQQAARPGISPQEIPADIDPARVQLNLDPAEALDDRVKKVGKLLFDRNVLLEYYL